MNIDFLFKKRVLYFLILVNILGTLFGVYYYAEQLWTLPAYLWIFVPASPISTMLFAISAHLNYANKGSSLIDALTFIGNFKYGLWTIFVLLYYFDNFYSANARPLYYFMLLSHLFMVLQSFLVFHWQNINFRGLLLAAAWFSLNDIVDYSLGTHTNIYTENVFPAQIAAHTLTLGSVLVAYIIIEKAEFTKSSYGS